jgi:sodium transport system ATP-binding protein
MIEVVDLQKSFGSTTALAGLSFQARDGEVTGLLGPNGAGKTTALRILYGIMRADGGAVRVDGIDALADTIGARARLGALPDNSGLYPKLTARENIRYFGRLQGVAPAAIEARIDELAPVLDMQEIINRRCEGFSHGERAKTSLVRVLVHNPSNVLLDEPTNGLDVMSVRALRQLILHLRGEGRCVVFSSHVMQEVAALCDRIVIVSHGRAVAAGTPDDLREKTGHASLEDAFVALTGAERRADS